MKFENQNSRTMKSWHMLGWPRMDFIRFYLNLWPRCQSFLSLGKAFDFIESFDFEQSIEILKVISCCALIQMSFLMFSKKRYTFRALLKLEYSFRDSFQVGPTKGASYRGYPTTYCRHKFVFADDDYALKIIRLISIFNLCL